VTMERIQRALEVSRLQRGAPADAAPNAVVVARVRPHRARKAAREAEVSPTRNEPAAALHETPVAGSEPAPVEVDATTALPPAREIVPPAISLPVYPLDAGHLRRRCVLLADDQGAAARAYRMLRAQLLQRVRSTNMRVFGVISAVSGEGKTLTAVNLALSLAAEPNQNVALIDFDLRHPSVAEKLGIFPAQGLETWLTGEQPVSSALCELRGVARLCVAPTLAPLDASSETLAGPRPRQLLDELKADDPRGLMILDLPPALLGDDVLTVAPLIDGFILVVTEGKTRREDVERVLELVGRSRIVGTLLNNSGDSEQRAY
jgi:protein-tyrosine kinase